MTARGHEERFLPPRTSAGCGFSKETFGGTRRNGEDAPIPAFRRAMAGPLESTLRRHSMLNLIFNANVVSRAGEVPGLGLVHWYAGNALFRGHDPACDATPRCGCFILIGGGTQPSKPRPRTGRIGSANALPFRCSPIFASIRSSNASTRFSQTSAFYLRMLLMA
jgi:hypothetical protein